MAQSYNRRINLYINGKEVKNDIASIRSEMNRLVNEQARMTIGSKEYIAQTNKIRSLKGVLDQHRKDIADVNKGWSMGKIGDAFNRYQALAMGLFATLTGLVLAVKAIVQSFNDFEERLDNLSALTGLSGKTLAELGEEAKRLSTSTLESGIRVTQSATDIVNAFTKVGSARPELLKDKEALVSVTKEAIILSNAAKIDLQPAIEGLTMVMNQYNVSAGEARRIINVLGAGSKEGAGEIPYLTTGFEKAGTTASMAGLSIETLAATLETLAPRFSAPEIAGRGLKGMLLRLQTGADDTNPKIVGMATALENLGKKHLTAAEQIDMFGLENVNVANTLIRNVEELKKYEKAITGTNVAIEQAAINTDNNNSKLAQAKNRLNVMAIELGQKLAPAVQFSTNALAYFVKGMTILIDFISKHKVAIISLIYSLTTYTIATKLAAMWEARLNKEKLSSIIIGKLQTWAYNAQFAAITLYNAGVALLRGNLLAATVQMRAFTAATKLNPIGLIIGLVVAAGTAMYFYTAKLTAAQQAQKMMNDINIDAQKQMVDQKVTLESLLITAKNKNLSDQVRNKAIKEINDLSPQYLSDITLENVKTKEAAEMVDKYTDSLVRNAKAIAYKNRLIEIEQKLIDLQSGEGSELTFWQKAKNAVLSFGNVADQAGRNVISQMENQAEQQAVLIAQKEKIVGLSQKEMEAQEAREDPANNKRNDDFLNKKYSELKLAQAIQTQTDAEYAAKNKRIEQIQNEITDHKNADPEKFYGPEESDNPVNPGPIKDLIRDQELLLDLANKMPASTEAEILARNKKVEGITKEIERLKELGTAKEGTEDDKKVKDHVALIDADNSKRIAAIKRFHALGLSSDAQYEAALLDQEIKYLTEKANAYKKGSKEYEAAFALAEGKKLEATEKVHKLLEEAEKELANAKIDNLQDGIDKQKAIEEQKWKEELEALQKRLLIKENLSDQEIKLNETTNAIIAEKKKEHEKNMSDLDQATVLKKQMDQALIDEANAQTQEEGFAAQRELAKANYDQSVIDAEGNAVLLAQAHRKLKDDLIRIKTEELSAREEIGNAMFNAANNLFGGLAELVGKETALGKALFLFQQAAAIGQVIFNTAIANAKAVAMFPLTGGLPWTAINTASAVGSIASIVAQTISGFSEGGYTGNGQKNEVAGTVHKGEYVIPANMLRNPQIASIVMGLEDIRSGRYGVTQQAYKTTMKKGFASGGFTSNKSVPSIIKFPKSLMGSTLSDQTALLLVESINELKTWKPELVISKYERQKKQWEETTNAGIS